MHCCALVLVAHFLSPTVQAAGDGHTQVAVLPFCWQIVGVAHALSAPHVVHAPLEMQVWVAPPPVAHLSSPAVQEVPGQAHVALFPLCWHVLGD
jgi:hypothetical protein